MKYTVKQGMVVSPSGGIVQTTVVGGYETFKARSPRDNFFVTVPVHLLLAYQKYKDLIFEESLMVVHIDGNTAHNQYNNIGLATRNVAEVPRPVTPPEKRTMKDRREYPHEAVRIVYDQTKSYKKTMELFGIASKSTLHAIIDSKSH